MILNSGLWNIKMVRFVLFNIINMHFFFFFITIIVIIYLCTYLLTFHCTYLLTFWLIVSSLPLQNINSWFNPVPNTIDKRRVNMPVKIWLKPDCLRSSHFKNKCSRDSDSFPQIWKTSYLPSPRFARANPIYIYNYGFLCIFWVTLLFGLNFLRVIFERDCMLYCL